MENQDHLAILKQGVSIWNKWRVEHLDIQPDFKGANLRGANHSEADLGGANLRGADLIKANLKGANLWEANFSGLIPSRLSGANLNKAILRGANLWGANLIDANFSRADLSGADLRRANFSGADLSGANLSGANLSGAFLAGIERGANLRLADLSRANFSGANLSGLILSRATLSGANLSGANLSGATLNEADLSGADLRNAVLWVTDLSTAQLSKTTLNGAYISEQQQEMLRDRDVIGVDEIKVVTLPRIITPNSSNTIQERKEIMPTGTNSEHPANSEPKHPRNVPSSPDIAHLIEEMSRLSTKQKNEIAKQVGLTKRTPTPKTVSFWKDIMAGGVAILAVLGFASLTILITTSLSNAAMSDVQWERYTFLLAGVETITFTAIGWLFGKEVHREQAHQAELRANETQNAMDTVVQENAKGRMVAKAVMAHANDPNMESLVEMVHTAYPDM